MNLPARRPAVPILALVAAAVVFGGLSRPSGLGRSDTGLAATSPGQRPLCAKGPELPGTWLTPGTVILFGDFHGTVELPAAFGEAVCFAASAGRAVLVGLEWPRDDQAAVERFLSALDEQPSRAPLFQLPFWTREFQDGRSSRAMASLLVRLRQLRQAGLHLELVLFDQTEGAGAQDRDAAMAERLAAEALARPQAVTMAFVGNFHARTTIGAPWNPDARPMGWYMRQAGASVKAIDGIGPAGTAWQCASGGPQPCGERRVDRGGRPEHGPTLEVFEREADGGFAGRVVVPAMTASPPVVPTG